MNEFFEFLTTSGGGIASQGAIVGAADSLVNTADLLVEGSRLSEGTIAAKDGLTVWVVTQDARFEVFRGMVSSCRREGSCFRIEGVTMSAFAQVDHVAARTWENATAMTVLRDLIALSRIPVEQVSYKASLSDRLLHVWNTDSFSVGEEIRSLLSAVDPSINILGSLDGRILVGTRDDIARSFHPMLYPFDDAVGETDTEITRFPMRSAYPGVACTGLDDGFVGTLGVVRHVIAPGQAYTDLILDDAPSEALEAWLGESSLGTEPLEAYQ